MPTEAVVCDSYSVKEYTLTEEHIGWESVDPDDKGRDWEWGADRADILVASFSYDG